MIGSLKQLYEILVKNGKDWDVLESLGYSIKNADSNVKYYQYKIDTLPEWKYFISDLDWTFYRGFTIELTIDYFVNYVKSLSINSISLESYKNFIEDYYYFSKIKQKAYNREVDFMLYLDVGIYFLYKYIDKFDYENFIKFLRDILHIKLIVNPYRFSIKKLNEVLQKGMKFLFISWASHFIFDLYLDLLKKYISNLYGKDLADNIYWFWSYSDFESKTIYNLWSYEQKKEFIKQIKDKKNIEIVWGMGDTISDFWIADNVVSWKDFYFVNPDYKVIEEFEKYKRNDINYHFINERKGFYFEYFIDDIRIF